jgi:hypothetical protein
MVVNIGVSSQWKVVTFKGTHLIERMSLLTLYIRKASEYTYSFVSTKASILLISCIVGEGVIDILKSVAKVVFLASIRPQLRLTYS